MEHAWKNHINSVFKNIMKSAGLIAKLRHYTNRNTLKLIYYALSYPYLTYGNLVWGNTYPTRLQKIMNVQKKIVRLICFKSYMDHSEPLFLDLQILNIYKLNDYLCNIFMYRINNSPILPEFYNSYFKLNNEIHNYNTRNSTKFHVNYKRTNHRKFTVFDKGITLWNKIDENMKKINSYFIFKKKAKLYCLTSD